MVHRNYEEGVVEAPTVVAAPATGSALSFGSIGKAPLGAKKESLLALESGFCFGVSAVTEGVELADGAEGTIGGGTTKGTLLLAIELVAVVVASDVCAIAPSVEEATAAVVVAATDIVFGRSSAEEVEAAVVLVAFLSERFSLAARLKLRSELATTSWKVLDAVRGTRGSRRGAIGVLYETDVLSALGVGRGSIHAPTPSGSRAYDTPFVELV